MDLYEVLADIDKETPVDKPTPASQVKPSTELSEEDRKQQRARNAVQSRLARTTALKRQGVNLVSADDSLAARLETRLKQADKRVRDRHLAARHAARQAVQAKVDEQGT
jgi:hypothetical protein